MNLTPEQLVKLITTAYQNKRGVFAKRVNAEDHIPKNITNRQKALFFFYIIQLDYATKSQRLYNGAKELWKYNKEYFTPEVIIKTPEKDLQNILNKYLKPRYINEAVKRWKINSQILLEEYKGSPLNIFKNTRDAIEIMNRIKNLRGFGPKIGNFFFRSMVNTFNFKLRSIEEISQPVDMHDVRLTYEWGFIKSRKMSPKNIKKVKEIWQKACKSAKISWLVFDRALWILGSEGIRTKNPKKDFFKNIGLQKYKR
jgi:endonuclease III